MSRNGRNLEGKIETSVAGAIATEDPSRNGRNLEGKIETAQRCEQAARHIKAEMAEILRARLKPFTTIDGSAFVRSRNGRNLEGKIET